MTREEYQQAHLLKELKQHMDEFIEMTDDAMGFVWIDGFEKGFKAMYDLEGKRFKDGEEYELYVSDCINEVSKTEEELSR